MHPTGRCNHHRAFMGRHVAPDHETKRGRTRSCLTNHRPSTGDQGVLPPCFNLRTSLRRTGDRDSHPAHKCTRPRALARLTRTPGWSFRIRNEPYRVVLKRISPEATQHGSGSFEMTQMRREGKELRTEAQKAAVVMLHAQPARRLQQIAAHILVDGFSSSVPRKLVGISDSAQRRSRASNILS